MSNQAETLLAKLVAFDTTSRKANRGLIDFVRDYLDSFGIHSDIIPGKGDGKACLWATVGNPDARGIALAGHTDVVPVDDQNWTCDPFTLTMRGDRLVGRGSADMKGFIACALSFVPEFLAAKTGSAFHLALTCDEETNMTGAQCLTNNLSARNIRPQWIWIGEPTGLGIVDQHKGVAAYRTRITGVPAHSSMPDQGLNAIEMAARFMTMIGEAAQQKKNQPYKFSAFDPPYTTFNLGTIAGGTAENIIAEKCEVMWQMRVHPGDVAQTIAGEIADRTATEFAPRFAAFAPRAGIDICTCIDIPPFLATADNPGTKILKKLLKCDHTHAVGFGTEAGIFQKLGAAAVICGPGFIEQAHQPDEYIDKKQLSACVDLMRGVLLSSSAPKLAQL